MGTHRYIFALLILIFGASAQDNKIYKMCVTENQATTSDCNILKKTESTINCVNVIDSTDCALKLERGEADFGIFTADEAILMSKFDGNEQRRVVAEIRDDDREEEQYKFQTVAIVKNSFAGPLSNLKGKNFCHPGFSKTQVWTDRVLKHFERVVVNRSIVCDKTSRTAAESELYALSSYFGKACHPGQWLPSEFSSLEKIFKQKYSNLCALCDSFKGCSYNPQADGNQFSALDCLTKKGGDVAYVSLYYAERYFGKVGPQLRNNINPGEYQFLCPNGTTQNFPTTKNPCTWIAQPWDAVVARNDEIADGLILELQKRLPTAQLKRSTEWVDTLAKVILGKDNDKKLFIEKNVYTLRSFIQEGREIPQPGTTVPCEHSIKWCTTSLKENEKCEWLRQAGVTQGVVPELECVQGTSKLNCFEKIKNNESDVVGIDTNSGTIAMHYYNLTTSLYQETEGKFRVVVVVKNELNVGLKDLRNKKACFPEFGGLSWTAFVNEIDKSKAEFCAFDNSMGNFFEQVCAPGANRRLDSSNSTEQNKFCQLCTDAFSGNQSVWAPFSKEDSCEVTTRNQFYGDVGALRCLGTGVADFAVINSYNLSQNLQDEKLPQDFANKYSIMCKNGTKVSFSTEIDDNCAIISVTGGEVVAKNSLTMAESRDLQITLQKYAEWFGYSSGHYVNLFHLFEPFNGIKDLLFRHETLDLITKSAAEYENYKAMQDYGKLKDEAETCVEARNEPDGAQIMEVQALTIFFMLVSTLVHVLVMF